MGHTMRQLQVSHQDYFSVIDSFNYELTIWSAENVKFYLPKAVSVEMGKYDVREIH